MARHDPPSVAPPTAPSKNHPLCESEGAFIERLSRRCSSHRDHVVVGIGDDCAVVRPAPGRLQLVTTDLLIERVHFLRHRITLQQLGAKALAVNLSDIAAMGGRPRDAYVSIAVPRDRVTGQLLRADLDALLEGIQAMASRFDVGLLGGDTNRSEGDLVINVVVTGDVAAREVLYRSGARPGDAIFVTGPLGDAAAGLHAILEGHTEASDAASILTLRHHEPQPQVQLGQRVAASGAASAMIDVSDGLAADLGHICRQSGVGCLIQAEALPLSPELRAYCAGHALDPIDLALHGGEDYVLCVTGTRTLPSMLGAAGDGVIQIGSIIAGGDRHIMLADGQSRPLEARGWDHFGLLRSR